jgi:phage protein D
VVRGADPDAEGPKQRIEVTRSWSDIGLDESLLGAPGQTAFTAATAGIREVIKPDDVLTMEDAIKAGDAHLRGLAATLITGSGVSVGLPELRAGRLVEIIGLGARFSGLYRLTKTTHTFGSSGYTTAFDVRKEVLA